jgi:nucleoside-diphosphate-sugar epimerase
MRKTILIIGNRGYLGGQLFHALDSKYDLIGFDENEKEPVIRDAIKRSTHVVFANGLSDHIAGKNNPYLDYEKNTKEYISYISMPEFEGKKVLYLGSICQYGPLKGVMDESCPCNPKEPQALNKFYMENYLRMIADKKSIKSCLIRLGAVFGAKSDCTNLSLLEKMVQTTVQGNVFDVLGTRKRLYSGLGIKQFLETISLIIEKDLFDGEVYNLSPLHISFGELEPYLELTFTETQGFLEGYKIDNSKISKALGGLPEDGKLSELIVRLKHEIRELEVI